MDPAKGNDNQPFSPSSGGIASPFKTIASAVAATRAVRATSNSTTATVNLRAGVYYLPETLSLGEQDSGLTITGYKSEAVVVSGGILADNLAWKPSASNPKVMVADLSGIDFPHGVKALQYEALSRPPSSLFLRVFLNR